VDACHQAGVIDEVSRCVWHELGIHAFFEDDVSAFPWFVVDQAPLVA
jgi:tartrate dehydratase beta subunit/fumarate hydratase class I family protein